MRVSLEKPLRRLRSTIDLPIYKSKRYEYVRMKDVEDPFAKLEFENFVKGMWRPLLWTEEEGVIQDAVFLDDFKRFQDYQDGSEVSID